MTDTIKKQLLKERHNFLGSYATIKEKEGGKYKYEVNLGRNYSTKLKGVFYNNKQVGRTKGVHSRVEGIKYLKELEALARNVDTSVSTDAKRDYINAREALDAKGYTDLTVHQAVLKWLKHEPIVSDQTVREAWDEFMTYKIEISGIKSTTQESLNDCGLRSLEPWLDEPLTDFESEALVRKLKNYIDKNWKKPRTRVNHYSKTSEFFKWCAKTCSPKKLTKNPLEDRDKIKVPKAKRNVCTVEQAERILQEAWKTDKEEGMLAYWVITLFLGTRPQSEMQWLTWDDVYLTDPDDSFIYVRESKMGEERRVDITPQAYEWLMICNKKLPIFKRGLDRKGEEIPSLGWYNKNRRDILNKAGILNDTMTTEEKKTWQDFQRHSCASAMWYSGKYDATDIANALDHSEATSRQYYKNKKVHKTDAERYLQIRPSTIGEKIVKIA